MKGIFITFEGGDGCGKSTQLKMLSAWLNEQGISCVNTKEPGGTEVGLELRKILVCGDKDKMDAIAEALLYYADRRIHLTTKVFPLLETGAWVLSDRFADSTVAYQYYGYNKRVPREVLDNLYNLAVGDFKPSLTIILDLDPVIGLSRSMAKAGGMVSKEIRHESRELEFHQNLRQGFLEIAKEEPNRCVVIDASLTIDELHENIKKVVAERFDLKKCQNL